MPFPSDTLGVCRAVIPRIATAALFRWTAATIQPDFTVVVSFAVLALSRSLTDRDERRALIVSLYVAVR